MRREAVLSVLLTCLSMPVCGSERLGPCLDLVPGYIPELNSRFGVNDPVETIVSFTAIPTHRPEWGVRVFNQDGSYFVRASSLSVSLWYSAIVETKDGGYWDFANAKPKISVKERPISKGVADRLSDSVHRTIGASDLPDEIVLDGKGVLYFLSSKESKCAVLDTRGNSSKRGELEKLISLLYAYAKRNAGNEADISKAIDRMN